MSSSNSVRIALIPEVTYGVTPVAGSFNTARFISEGLSGTPDTVESQQIRTDRLSSGQIVTGLTVGGQVGFELAKEDALDLMIESAMYNSWGISTLVTTSLTIATGPKTITRSVGSFITDGLVVGDFITLGGFTAPTNNTQVMVTSVTALVIGYNGPEDIASGTGVTTTFKRLDKISIGTTKKSFSMEKTFTDLTTKAINYRGMIAASMELSVAFGELIKGSFTFSGNDYVTADAAIEQMTNGRTIIAPATTNTLNGSVDLPFLASSETGLFVSGGLCIQNISLTLNNNLSPQTCIGSIAPENYTPGTAGIEISLSSYLKDENWSFMDRKLSQQSFSIGFIVRNSGGAYAFYIPAIQVSFDDPSSGGPNQDITLDMKGTAKVGTLGENALTIYRL